MPDTESRTPAIHPMDPRCCENLSPMFTAFLCRLLDLTPMTEPAITGIAVTGTASSPPQTPTLISTRISAVSRISSATSAAGARPAAPMPQRSKTSSPQAPQRRPDLTAKFSIRAEDEFETGPAGAIREVPGE